MKTQELTRAELEIMQILWKIEKGFVNDILEAMPSPKPAYNTVSTIVRILEKKEFVAHLAFGKSHQYYPLIDQKSYTKSFMAGVLDNFFGGSIGNMVNFFSHDKQITASEADEIIKMLKENNQ